VTGIEARPELVKGATKNLSEYATARSRPVPHRRCAPGARHV